MNKRIWILFGTLICMFFLVTPLSVFATDTVYYGKYVQEKVDDTQEKAFVVDHLQGTQYLDGVRYVNCGDDYYKDAPIEWYVIKDNGDSYILLSKYILTNYAFTHDITGSHFWNDSCLRDFLNNEFMEKAFSAEQQKYLQTMTLSTKECTYEAVYIDRKEDPYEPITTNDKVFILSKDEIEGDNVYSLDKSTLKGVRTPWRIAEGETDGDWYLRGPRSWNHGNQTAPIMRTDENDGSQYFKDVYGTYKRGVRPCICVKKNAPGLSYEYPGEIVPASLIEKITITYNANKGKNAPKKQIVNAGEKVSLSSCKPTRKGYIFKGWSTEQNGKVKYTAAGSFIGAEDITLYAVWQRKPKVYVLIMAGSYNTESWYLDNWKLWDPLNSSKTRAKRVYLYFKSGKRIRIDNKDNFVRDYLEMIAPAISTRYDVKTLKKTYKNMKLSGYQKAEVKVVTTKQYFKKREIDNTISKFFGKAKSGDLCYFVYCGHGYNTGKTQGIGCKKTKNGTPYYSYARLLKTIDKSCKGRVVMFLPVCHSGGCADYARKHNYKRITVLPACNYEETTGNTAESNAQAAKIICGVDKELSDYVYYMKKGLGNPAIIDSGNKDHKISVKEFAAYMKKKMNKRGVHPKYWAGKNKDLVIFEY